MVNMRKVLALMQVFRERYDHKCDFNFCDIAVSIVCRSELDFINEPGLSNYAKRRRARRLGRCVRCFRVNPGFYFTKRCDGITCVPGISWNYDVEDYIKRGRVTGDRETPSTFHGYGYPVGHKT
ncbi:putative nucleic acid binding protein [Poplar mosaic virus (ATCC PV257)]|uniref:RNA silencing suppressor n=1 Tax=Poplar mosaic virus (isolate ATCC Pv275) TaxID=31709 RepID=VSR_POPMV|nr:RecName: Full=RNA silencing suppressor; AltName: Full=14 kDa protein; AltName: Full=Putative nucleic acid-binding protein [Poplar mosaic virus (ATCC PV257)]CAA46227.2 putative nucleic acid binding protein [Poplar mosaic virus (ATCC PV257)]